MVEIPDTIPKYAIRHKTNRKLKNWFPIKDAKCSPYNDIGRSSKVESRPDLIYKASLNAGATLKLNAKKLAKKRYTPKRPKL